MTHDLEQIARSISRTPTLIRQLLEDAGPKVTTWHAQPGDWCINEIVGHLLAADEPAFVMRIQRILEVDQPDLAGWDEQRTARTRRDCQQELADLVTALAAQRQMCADFVRGLEGRDLGRSCTFEPYGELRASDFLNEWYYHDLEHLQQIMQILKRLMWPAFTAQMKNALSK